MNVQLLFNALAAFAGIWLAISLLMSLAYPLYARKLAAIGPAQRAAALRLLALTPALSTALICIELFVLPDEFVPLHCHHSNCAAHDPDPQLPLTTLAVLAALFFLPLLLQALNLLWSNARLQRRWRRLSTPAGEYRYLDIAQQVACIVGLLRPTIYFSRGFIVQLSPIALRVVIAHEQAHAARHDNLWTALVRVASLGWITRRRLAADLELAQEQACDQRAARSVGDATAVAETLLQCQRLAQTPQVACAFFSARQGRGQRGRGQTGRGQLAARVHLLLEPQHSELSPLMVARFAGLALILAMLSAIPLHHLIEFL